MDTTPSLHLDSSLLQRAARCARSEGRDLTAVLETLLREYVDDADQTDLGQVWARMDRSVRHADAELGGYDDLSRTESN